MNSDNLLEIFIKSMNEVLDVLYTTRYKIACDNRLLKFKIDLTTFLDDSELEYAKKYLYDKGTLNGFETTINDKIVTFETKLRHTSNIVAEYKRVLDEDFISKYDEMFSNKQCWFIIDIREFLNNNPGTNLYSELESYVCNKGVKAGFNYKIDKHGYITFTINPKCLPLFVTI